MGHGSARGSAPVKDEEDDSPVEEIMAEETALCQAWCDVSENNIYENSMMSKGFWDVVIRVRLRIDAFCAIINNVEENHESGTNDLDVYHKACAEYKMMYKQDFTLEHCYNILKDHPGWKDVEMPTFYNTQGRRKSKTSETTSGSASGGLNLNKEADGAVEETQEFRPMGRDRAKAKKKAAGSSRGGSSSFVDLVADKFFNIKQKNGERRTSNNYRIQESGVEYPRGRDSRNCTIEKRETKNSASNA
uniref:No apical meristem-associated C-terminal domain-containing protein n=1 Tax=Tanacetum cinerariifolium TaxID=118510 RepID=A0A6L2NFQ4_TANCI|nr:hypothetical protein [Tanacetum cinerariifolium]